MDVKEKLSPNYISKNYQHCYNLTAKLLQKQAKHNGFEIDCNQQDYIDLIQSVIGYESVVELIQYVPYNETDYLDVVSDTIKIVRRLFYPDVKKNRYISIFDRNIENITNDLPRKEPSKNRFHNTIDDGSISDLLSPDLKEYFEKKLKVNYPIITKSFLRLPNSESELLRFKNDINKKVYLFKKFYPDGKINFNNNINVSNSLCEQEIINIYINIYLGIEQFFPKNFLLKEPVQKSAILVRFLVEQILEEEPFRILEQKDETLFLKHKLQNIYRYFNYSCNRALANAYPEIIHPWLFSKTPAEYWHEKKNRINAVKWLIEKKLNYSPDFLYKSKITKKDFAENGLSYLFNSYYNSVKSALEEAYEEKKPWELGKVALSFWSDKNCTDAIKWMCKKQKWTKQQLPEKFISGELNRKTFSRYGLATMFEKRFNKNIYKAISVAFPNTFYPWQFGKVPSGYWTTNNISLASQWIANCEGIETEKIVNSILNKKLTLKLIEKHSVGRILKKRSKGKMEILYNKFFWKDFKNYLEEQRILRKIKNQKKYMVNKSFLQIILYGLFAKQVAKTHLRQQRVYHRISNRIIQNMYN